MWQSKIKGIQNTYSFTHKLEAASGTEMPFAASIVCKRKVSFRVHFCCIVANCRKKESPLLHLHSKSLNNIIQHEWDKERKQKNKESHLLQNGWGDGTRITGDTYIGSLFRVDEPFPMIRRRTVIFLVRVATQSIPKKKAKKIPQGWLPCGTRWSNTLEECYACNFFFSLRFSIYR